LRRAQNIEQRKEVLAELQVAQDVEFGNYKFDEVVCELKSQSGREFQEAFAEILDPLTHDVVGEQKKQ
jgi:hypothetical protein